MKSKFVKKRTSIDDLCRKIKNTYINRYYNMFMKFFNITDLEPEQIDYVMRKFWDTGTNACFPIKKTGEVGFAQYTINRYNMYDFPEEIILINKWNMPFFPKGNLTVNQEAVLGWINPNHKPIREVVELYSERMAQVDMVINTNLQLHKMPFLVKVTPENVEKAKDIIDRILNNEIAVFADFDDVNLIDALATHADYVIDKLYAYKSQLEGELLTILGMDNPLTDPTLQSMTVDAENANNAQINQSQETMLSCLKDFFDKINELFGRSITVELRVQPVESVHEDPNASGSGVYEDKEDRNDGE